MAYWCNSLLKGVLEMPRLGGNPNTSNLGTARRDPRQQRPIPPLPSRDIMSDAAEVLDDRLFVPLFDQETATSELEKSLASKFADLRDFAEMNEQLKKYKVYSAAGALLCFSLAVRSVLQGRVTNVVLYAVLGHDLFRVSYNCFIRKYISNAVKRLGDNVFSAAANTFLSMVQSAVFGKPDVIQRLQQELQFEALADGTISQRLLAMVPRAEARPKRD